MTLARLCLEISTTEAPTTPSGPTTPEPTTPGPFVQIYVVGNLTSFQILTDVRLFHARTEARATTILTLSLVIVFRATLETIARPVSVS